MIKLWQKKGWAALLLPLSWLYGLIIYFRNNQYLNEKKTVFKFSTLVISVGNITVGGTGKTPLIGRIVADLNKMRIKSGILSRGYGRKHKSPVLILNSEQASQNWKTFGDEPLLLFKKTGRPVAVSPNRKQAGDLLLRKISLDTLLLDDAYQHFQIHRDINILTIDALQPWGNGWLIPAGPMREKFEQITRADVIVLTRTDQSTQLDQIERKIRSITGVPVFHTIHQPVGWVKVQTNQKNSLESLDHKLVLAFAGIGNPQSFLKTVDSLGITVLEFMHHADHHRYTSDEVKNIDWHAQKTGAVAIVTTEKDAIKIIPEWCGNIPVYALEIEIQFTPSDKEWKKWLKENIKTKRKK